MNVPALRFSEFGREWEEKRLGAIAQFSKGKGISKADVVESGMTPCVRYGELYTTYGRQIETVISFTNGPESELFLSAGGEILIPASGETAYDIATATVLPHSNVAIGGDLNIVKTAEDGFFIASYLSGKRKRHLARMAQGNSVVHLYKEQIASTSLHLPTLPEQKKIAAFLGAVDARIAGARKRRDLLETYKRGLMQALFSRTLRFTRDDGTTFPDWEEQILGSFCSLLSGYPVSGDDISETETHIQLLRGANITEGRIRHSPDIDRYHAGNIENLDRFILKVDDVVIGMDGSKVGKNVAVIDSYNAGSFLIQRVARLRSDTINDLRYVYYHVTSFRFRRYVDIVNTSSGIPHISLKQIRDFPIQKPHPNEQQKIADALSAMDAKIDAVAGQIAQLEAFKKGLLQQMFV